MKTTLSTRVLSLLIAAVLSASALGDAFHPDAPGLTLYVRVFTSATASVAAALTEGTGGAVGLYYVTDANLLAAGLSSASTTTHPDGFVGKVFAGTPSTTANDPWRGNIVIPWNGTAAMRTPVDLRTIEGSSSMLSTFLADIATIGAYIDLFHESTVNSAPTTTTVILNTGPPDNNALLRHLAVFIDQSDPLQTSAVPVTNYVASTKTVTLHESPAFTLAANDIVFFIPVGFSVADVEPYAGSDLEADIAGIDAGMGAAAAIFDNTEVVQGRVIEMSSRNDGTTVGTKPARMRVGEKHKFWLDMEDVIGDGVWVDDAENPVSSSPSQLVVTATLGVNRELVVVELDAASAIVGATYTVTCDVEPRVGEIIKAKFEVRIASD